MTGEGVPASALVLHLGYEDDNYNDNGYDRHDDGTEDQCKGDNGNDGGPAHITVTICRGVSCGPATSRFDFDVLSSQVDPNGFLLNPHWSWQDRPGNHGKIPSTSRCHEFSKHDVARPPSPNFPDCTDQSGLDNVDTPGGVNWAVCQVRKRVPFGIIPFSGHVTGSRLPLRAMPAGLRTNGRTTTTISRLRATATQKGRFTNHCPDVTVDFYTFELIPTRPLITSPMIPSPATP